ncbi:B2 bradykinin receptor [Hippocampus zosterae]|uniref:B2 bradykinin receptor n=1 Tax=Hippocampus zosterae TaxID=109293 RepID=UPI00223CB4CF|nr:B2 bradykinin receptor [Hippocampus zosterae]
MAMNASISESDSCNYTATLLLLMSTLQPPYLGVISFVGFLGNSFVMAVFCLQRKNCTAADVYLGNMAAADLVMMTCLPFWAFTIARGHQWVFGEVLCKLVNVAIYMNYICSILFLTLVSLDRYLALVKPMSPSRLRRPLWAKRICLGTWMLGFLFSMPVLLFRTVRYVQNAEVDACILVYPHLSWRVQHNIFINVFGFLIPVMVLSYCTCHIVAVLSKNQVRVLPGMRTERRATHLVLAVMAVFLFCWTPHQAMRFLDTLEYFQITSGCIWGYVLDLGIQLSTYLAYSNSAVNPFLFTVVGKHFRRRAKEVFVKTLSHWSNDVTTSFTSVKVNGTHMNKTVETLTETKQTALFVSDKDKPEGLDGY